MQDALRERRRCRRPVRGDLDLTRQKIIAAEDPQAATDASGVLLLRGRPRRPPTRPPRRAPRPTNLPLPSDSLGDERSRNGGSSADALRAKEALTPLATMEAERVKRDEAFATARPRKRSAPKLTRSAKWSRAAIAEVDARRQPA